MGRTGEMSRTRSRYAAISCYHFRRQHAHVPPRFSYLLKTNSELSSDCGIRMDGLKTGFNGKPVQTERRQSKPETNVVPHALMKPFISPYLADGVTVTAKHHADDDYVSARRRYCRKPLPFRRGLIESLSKRKIT